MESTTEGKDLLALGISPERLGFLAKLPELLNSSLNTRSVIKNGVDHLKNVLDAEAATVFLLSESGNELTFWALGGGDSARLEGKKMPIGTGIVGWVIENKEPLLVQDVENDPRFFSTVDREGKFKTKNVICVPLIVRGDRLIGAIQVLNKKGEGNFTEADLLFVDQFAHQAALAIENAKLYEASLSRNQKYETVDKRKNEIITVISHEFLTPLSVIQNSADMLTMIDDKNDKERMAEKLMDGVARLLRLIEEIKSVSFLSDREMNLELKRIGAKTLFKALKESYQKILEERSLTLTTKVEPADVAFVADPKMIVIALKHLIDNAIRFTPNKGEITVSAIRMSGMVEIEVKDTGIGIEESQQPLIFESFYEVTDIMSHSSGTYQFRSAGLGLGLPIVKRILNEHGAEIEVQSVVDQGSSFKFNLQAA